MNYKVIDYYLALLLPICYRKQSSLPKIPPDIARYIFSFLGPKKIMHDLNEQKLITDYNRTSRNISRNISEIIDNLFENNTLCFHPFVYLPYPNIITIKEIVSKFIELAKEKKHKISFSHVCCTDKGCVFNIQKECLMV